MQPTDELWFDNQTSIDLIEEKLKAAGQDLKRLTLLNQAFLISGRLNDLSLPNLKELVVPSLYYFDSAEGWSFLHNLTKLETLVAEYTEAKESILQGLCQAPWWQSLRHLELKLASLKDGELWKNLWTNRSLDLQVLCLFFLSGSLTSTVLSSKLKSLEYLILGTELGDKFLFKLSTLDLPALTDLDLSYSSVTEAATLEFLKGDKPGLPKLARVRKRFFSEKPSESRDWDGSQVGWTDEELSDREMQERFFEGTGLRVLPANEQLNIRGQMLSRLRPIERPKHK